MSTLLGPPSLSGYLAFLRGVGMSAQVLPDNAYTITLSFAIAQGIVSCQLNAIDPDIFSLATYNLATDRLIHFAPDQPNLTFFSDLRKSFNVAAFIAGVVEASSDEATSQTLAVPDSLKNLSLLDLSNMQTPYGRMYMAFAQQLGTLWGLTSGWPGGGLWGGIPGTGPGSGGYPGGFGGPVSGGCP